MKKNIIMIITVFFIMIASLFLIKRFESSHSDILPIVNKHGQVGDIVLLDGTIVKAENYTHIDKDNLPIAIIASIDDSENIFVIGLNISETPLSWASDNSQGYTTYFHDLSVEKTNNEYAMKATFTGHLSGKDSLDILLYVDQEDTKDLKSHYPAFDFARTYPTQYGLTGDYSTNWYIPSIAELCTIYKNRDIINQSLQTIHQLDPLLSINGLDTNWYWSSSQATKTKDYAWFVHFMNGYVDECPKNFTNLHALVIHELLGDVQ